MTPCRIGWLAVNEGDAPLNDVEPEAELCESCEQPLSPIERLAEPDLCDACFAAGRTDPNLGAALTASLAYVREHGRLPKAYAR